MVNQFLILELGERIRNLRAEKNYSQEDLSFVTGFHRTYIGMIERGERNISLTNLAVFAKAFELDLSELVDFSSSNPKQTYQAYEFKTKE